LEVFVGFVDFLAEFPVTEADVFLAGLARGAVFILNTFDCHTAGSFDGFFVTQGKTRAILITAGTLTFSVFGSTDQVWGSTEFVPTLAGSFVVTDF
jgi:hypothetical protein